MNKNELDHLRETVSQIQDWHDADDLLLKVHNQIIVAMVRYEGSMPYSLWQLEQARKTALAVIDWIYTLSNAEQVGRA